MNQLRTGQFFGQTNKTTSLSGITLTDTEYVHEYVDWHYHENAYFTLVLQGNITEGNKKEIYDCSAGSLIFHNWHEPHYNIKPKGFTRGFHLELEPHWFDEYALKLNDLHGSFKILNPDVKLLLYKIFKETKLSDNISAMSITDLIIQIFTQMLHANTSASGNKPSWVSKIKEILHDINSVDLSIKTISDLLNIHPVHLSRDFSKYFQCNLGEYVRKLKLERSLSMLSDKDKSLTQIAFDCGFSDQSHFIRCFKKIYCLTPFKYREVLLR